MTIEKLKQIISTQMGIPAEKITDQSDLINDLGADSLDLTELVMTIEQAFNIMIEEDEYHNAHTVETIVALIDSKLTN